MHVTLFGCRVDTRVTLVHVEAVVLSLAKVRAERLEHHRYVAKSWTGGAPGIHAPPE
jgi:hypothetical protein